MTKYRTKAEIKRQWTCQQTTHDLKIPKWTECRPVRDGEGNPRGYFVDDLSWIDAKSILYSDAYHYGIVVAEDDVEEVLE